MRMLVVAIIGAVLVAMLVGPAARAAGEVEPPRLPAVPAVSGVVLEVADAGAFTYLRLKTPDGEIWAGVRRANVAPGARVTIDDPVVMRNFESKALKRSFAEMVFGTLAAPAGAPTHAPTAAPAAMPAAPTSAISAPTASTSAAVHGSASGTPDPRSTKVAKADGADARTIAEVHSARVALAGQPVTIRARVVKVTPGVLGKNWIHLRDGSGSPADASDDLVVTSTDEPSVGEIVVARGVVRTDVNLGSGYAFKVMVEDASLRK